MFIYPWVEGNMPKGKQDLKLTQNIGANKELISIFEQKIKDRINAVWGVVD